MRHTLLALACLAIAGCPVRHGAAGDGPAPQIRVAPGAAARWIAALGGARDSTDATVVGPARVHAMREGEELGGPNAIGRPGDLVLEEEQVVFVIDQVMSSHGFAESGGNVIDAADAHARRDELGQIFTYFGVFPRQAVYEALSSGATSDGAACVQATGRELRQPTLAVTTRYTLRPPDRALLIETSIENTSTSSTVVDGLGDAIQWGGAEKVAPGEPTGFKGRSSGAYVGGVGRFTSYALTSTDGVIAAVSGGSWTDTTQRSAVALAPHESARYARMFVVGERPDTTSIVSELAGAAGTEPGALRLVLPRGSVLPTGAVFRVWPAGAREAMTLAAPFAGALPAGDYAVALWAAAGSAMPSDAKPVHIEEGVEAQVDMPRATAATLETRCVDPDARPVPCTVTFVGTQGTPVPDFGPSHLASPARNQTTTADGSCRVAMAPGSYAITASRGPEYTLSSVDVHLETGEEKQVTLPLRRVVDTAGYLACDFRQHSMVSADAPVAAGDRVVSNAAEGVEVAVATEHHAGVDLEPLVRERHLERDMVEISGDELTSDANRRPWGHANAFPMVFDAAKPRGGSPPLRQAVPTLAGDRADRTPATVFAWVRAHVPGDAIVQISHLRSGSNGYFDLLRFDPARGKGVDPAYAAAFDTVEVLNSRNVAARARVVDDWRALLRTGHAVTPTANTDTHGIVGQEAGYPRTMVHVRDDAHLDAWDDARTADLVHGVKGLRDVVLTNGPMLRVTANGTPVGGTMRGPVVHVRVHVECAPWVDVDTVRVLRAGGSQTADMQDRDQKTVRLAALVDGPLGTDVVFDVRMDGLTPVLAGDDREIRPWAMTGAIWIRADTGGRR